MSALNFTSGMEGLSGNLTDMGNQSMISPQIDNTQLLMNSVSRIMYTKVLIVIVSIGMVGNMMSIYLILADKQMRNISSSIYLLSVLSSDTGVLLTQFLVWLEAVGYPLNHLPVICNLYVYLQYVCGFLSIWYIVCITVETFITICHPTKIKQMCTLFRARIVALVLFVTSLLLFVILPVITRSSATFYPQYNRTIVSCMTLPQFTEIFNIVAYTDTVLTLVLPFIILIILLTLITLAIIQSIQRKKKRSIKKTASNGGTGSSSSGKLPQVRVAKMLFILSCSVVVLSAPSHVFRIKSMFMSQKELSLVEGFIQLVFLFFSYCSYSVKVFICVACSQNFRKLFMAQFCCFRKKTYNNVPTNTMETTA